MKFDLLREKAYSMGENIQNLWTAPSMGDAIDREESQIRGQIRNQIYKDAQEY